MTLHWHASRFAELGVDALYDLLALRARIFVVEQACAYLDPDGADRDSWHLLGRDGRGVLVAGLRIVHPGVKYAEPSLGRIVTAPEVRGTGLGRELVAEGLARCAALWPGQRIRIGAQARLQRFYRDFGFAVASPEYDEDGIAHVEMLR